MTAQARLLGGRYQVGELLGYGGMAEVHRGRDLRLGRDVAIKMLRTDLARDATFQERFRREAEAAAKLSIPNQRPICTPPGKANAAATQSCRCSVVTWTAALPTMKLASS